MSANIPNVPLGIGPPNNLSMVIYSGSSNLDLTTVSGVTLNVVRTYDGSTATWTCSIPSMTATSTEMNALYAFQRPAASGTFSLTNGQTGVVSSVSAAVPVGSLIFFSTQPFIFYTVGAVNGTMITLTTPYSGVTNAAATASYTIDVNVLGMYNIAVLLTAPGGIVPAYSFQLNATPPSQTSQHSP